MQGVLKENFLAFVQMKGEKNYETFTEDICYKSIHSYLQIIYKKKLIIRFSFFFLLNNITLVLFLFLLKKHF